MDISSKNFDLDESLDLVISSPDSDRLINIPNKILIKCLITNNYGKILINNISIETIIDDLSLKQKSISDNLEQLDIKNIDRYIFKQITNPAQINHDSYKYFFTYDLSMFEKGRRPSETDWAVFASLYCFSCHIVPKSMNVFLPLAKFLRISEENIKKFIKKTPEKVYRKSGSVDERGGDLSLYGEDLIKRYFENNIEMLRLFEKSPYLKFYSELG